MSTLRECLTAEFHGDELSEMLSAYDVMGYDLDQPEPQRDTRAPSEVERSAARLLAILNHDKHIDYI